MFKRLVSNLPYSPQIINDISFYAKRLGQEQFTRKLSMVFMVLAMMVQTAVFISPSEPALAASSNDVVYGGLTKDYDKAKELMLKYYDQNSAPAEPGSSNHTGIVELFNKFGVTRSDIINSTATTVSGTDTTLYSVGRKHKSALDQRITTSDGQVYYMRPFHIMLQYPERKHAALKIPGKNIYILLYCGNFVVKGTPTINKSSVPSPGSKVQPGDKITYKLKFGNTGHAPLRNLLIKDPIDPKTNFVSQTSSTTSPKEAVLDFKRGDIEGTGINNVDFAYWYWWQMNYPGKTNGTSELVVQVSESAKDGDQICNTAYIRGSGLDYIPSQKICHTVDIPPKVPDVDIQKISTNGSEFEIGDVINYEVKVTNTGELSLTNTTLVDNLPQGLVLDSNSKKQYKISIPGSLSVNQSKTFNYKARVTEQATSKIQNQICVTSNETDGNRCDTETVTINLPEPEPVKPDIAIQKEAQVINNNTDDPRSKPGGANNSTVKAGEIIEYTLTVTNNGDGEEKDYQITEDLADVLEYAKMIDPGDGKLNEENTLVFRSRDIKPKESIKKSFRVQILDPIPKTPTSVSDGQSYDLIMTNVFGNEVNIKLKKSVQKQIEGVNKELPKTGIGSNIAFTILFFSIVSYFYSRNKQLVKEIQILRQEYNSGVRA